MSDITPQNNPPPKKIPPEIIQEAMRRFGCESLIGAIAAKNMEALTFLLQHGANPFAKNKRGSTPLTLAALKGNFEAVKIILEYGKDVGCAAAGIEIKNNFGLNALHYAARIGNLDIVKLLIKYGANPNEPNTRAKTPCKVSKANNIDSLQRMKKRTARVETDCEVGYSPLIYAAKKGKTDVVKFLLELADSSPSPETDEESLHDKNVEDCSPKAPTGRVDVNARDCFGRTALMHATWDRCANSKTVELLIKHGADINAQDKDGSTPILFATFGGKLDILKTLIKHGANTKSTNSYRLSPLMLAAKTGNLQITKFLLELDNTPNPSSKLAPTDAPLSNDSSEEGDPRSGAKSETHLHTSPPSASAEWCFCSSSRSDEEEDPQHGQDVGGVAAKDEFSRTPLFFATENGNLQIVELLLKHGANPNVSDDFGKTPIQIATENNRQDLIDLFNDYTSQTTSTALNSPPHTNNQPTTNQALPLEREGGPVANATGDRMKREHRARKKI